MRFEKLLLTRFGPFTDAEINFGPSPVGLHIVHGPNEAGKSSSLRAVQNFLFGIPAQSSDNFRHNYKDLRIGGVVRDLNGEVVHVVRKKGNKQTLLDVADMPVPDDTLMRFLPKPIDQGSFDSRFGINHERLRKGGEEIAKGKGDIGELLFAAGGIRDIRSKLESLVSARDELLRASGRVGEIHDLIARREELEKSRKSAEVSVATWELHRDRRDAARLALANCDQELKQLRAERHRRSRYRDALPQISEWTSQQSVWECVRDAVELPEDFPQRRAEYQRDLKNAGDSLAEIDRELEQRRSTLLKTCLDPELLRQRDVIEELNDRRAQFEQAVSDRPGLEGNLAQAKRQIEDIYKDLNRPCELAWGSADWDTLRIPIGQRTTIQQLANQFSGLVQQAEDAARQFSETEQELRKARRDLEQVGLLRDSQTLEEAVRQGTRLGEPDERLRQLDLKLVKVRQSISRLISGLPLWNGDPDQLVALPIPAEETIDRFKRSFGILEREHENLTSELDKSDRAELELRTQLLRLETDGTIPSEVDLLAIRERRRAGWELIRRRLAGEMLDEQSLQAWLQASGGIAELAETYDAVQQAADELSDRLRSEADAVARKKELLRQVDELARSRQAFQVRERKLQEKWNDYHREWQDVWSFLGQAPLPPDEMAAWCRRHSELTRLNDECSQLEQERQQLVELRDQAIASLSEAMTAAGGSVDTPTPTLSVLLDRGGALADELNTRKNERDSLQKQIAKLMSQLESWERKQAAAQSAIHEWETKWATEMERIGLDPQASVVEAQRVLERLGDLGKLTHEARGFEDRISQIDAFSTTFRRDTSTLLQRLGRPTDAEPPELAIRKLVRELEAARQASDSAAELSRLIEGLEQKQRGFESDIRRAHDELAKMCREASVVDVDALPEAERRSSERRRTREEIERLQKSLTILAEGTPLDDFVKEARGYDSDALNAEIQAVDERITQQDHLRTAAISDLRSAEDELKRIDGRDDAVHRHAEDYELVTAAIEERVRRYLALTVAIDVLRQGIEAYRQRNQGPILSRAGELFSTLTCGSFERLRADYDEKDQPTLVGVRQGTDVSVSGMSDGTLDQLYLALRIASLEHWLESHTPVPFLIDDVLITFDDTRAAAALRVLAELSRKTQVVFFTHHEHLLEVARASLPGDMFHVHELGKTAGGDSATPGSSGRKSAARRSRGSVLFEES